MQYYFIAIEPTTFFSTPIGYRNKMQRQGVPLVTRDKFHRHGSSPLAASLPLSNESQKLTQDYSQYRRKAD